MVKHLPAIRETWVWSLDWEDPLEEDMAAHSNILAWRIPRTEDPGGLQSMGSQRVGYDCDFQLVNKNFPFYCNPIYHFFHFIHSLKKNFFLIVLGVHCCTQAFSSCGKWASHCSDLSCCRAHSLGTRAQRLWCPALAAPRYAESSRTRDWTLAPCTGRRILPCFTTRAVKFHSFFMHFILSFILCFYFYKLSHPVYKIAAYLNFMKIFCCFLMDYLLII